MSKLENILKELRTELPLNFMFLNGEAANELRALNTSWPKTETALAGMFIDEVALRFRHGVVNEIGDAILTQAESSASQTLVFNKDFSFSDVAKALFEQATAMSDRSIIVVTTTGLRMLQMDPRGLFKRNTTEVFTTDIVGPLGLVQVGELSDIPVFCNPQAKDPETILILGAGWFQYSSTTLLDAVEEEKGGATIVSDLKIETVPQAIRAIRVNADAIKFR